MANMTREQEEIFDVAIQKMNRGDQLTEQEARLLGKIEDDAAWANLGNLLRAWLIMGLILFVVTVIGIAVLKWAFSTVF